jgi:two-component system OmpR family response regulator
MNRRRALIVDDEKPFNDVLRELLSLEGFDVQPAYNAATARQLIEASPPDLVVLDVRLPDVNGFTLLRQLRDKGLGSSTKVIIVSAHATREEMAQALLGGADAFLLKPFAMKQLQAALAALWSRNYEA